MSSTTSLSFLQKLGIVDSLILGEIELGFSGHEGYSHGYLVELPSGERRFFITEFDSVIEVSSAYFEEKLRNYKEWVHSTEQMLDCYYERGY